MRLRQAREDAVAFRGQLDEHRAPVVRAALPPHEPALLAAVDEAHRALMLDLQPLRDGAHRRFFVLRQPLQRQQQLMLLRLEARLARRRLTEADITAELVTKL